MAELWNCCDPTFCTLVGLLIICFNYSDSQSENRLKTENGRLLALDEANALPVPDAGIGVAITSNLRSIERKRRSCSANIVQLRNFPRTNRYPCPVSAYREGTSAHDGHDELDRQHHRFCKCSSLISGCYLIVGFSEATRRSPFLFSDPGLSVGQLQPDCHRSELQGLEKRE